MSDQQDPFEGKRDAMRSTQETQQLPSVESPAARSEWTPAGAHRAGDHGEDFGFHEQVGDQSQVGYSMGLTQFRPTNGFAIASLITGILGFFVLLTAPIAIIFGHVSLSKIKKTGENGRGMAIAGLVLGYVGTIFLVLTIVGIALFIKHIDRFVPYFEEQQTGDVVMSDTLETPRPESRALDDEVPPGSAGAELSDDDPLREARCAALNDYFSWSNTPNMSLEEQNEVMTRLIENQSDPQWRKAVEDYWYPAAPGAEALDAFGVTVTQMMLDCEDHGYSINI